MTSEYEISPPSEKERDFMLHLNWAGDFAVYQEPSEQVLGRCDDGAFSAAGGHVTIDFGRVAPTLDDAIRSAVRDVQAVRYSVDSVQVGLKEVPQWREAA